MASDYLWAHRSGFVEESKGPQGGASIIFNLLKFGATVLGEIPTSAEGVPYNSLTMGVLSDEVEIVRGLINGAVKEFGGDEKAMGDFLNGGETVTNSTPLHVAVQKGSVEIAQLLVERGASPVRPAIHCRIPTNISRWRLVQLFPVLTRLIPSAER